MNYGYVFPFSPSPILSWKIFMAAFPYFFDINPEAFVLYCRRLLGFFTNPITFVPPILTGVSVRPLDFASLFQRPGGTLPPLFLQSVGHFSMELVKSLWDFDLEPLLQNQNQ